MYYNNNLFKRDDYSADPVQKSSAFLAIEFDKQTTERHVYNLE